MLSYSHTVHCAFLLWPKQQHTTSDTRLFLLRSPPVVVADTSGRVIVRGEWVLEKSQTSLDWFGAYDQQRCARASGNTEPGCLGCKPHWWHEMLLQKSAHSVQLKHTPARSAEANGSLEWARPTRHSQDIMMQVTCIWLKDNLEEIKQDAVDHRRLLDDAPLVFCEDVGIATFDFWLLTIVHHHTQHSACQRKAKRKKKIGRICQHQKTGLCWTYSGWKTCTATIQPFGQHGPNGPNGPNSHVACTALTTDHITVCTAHNNQKQRTNKHSWKLHITGQCLDSQV